MRIQLTYKLVELLTYTQEIEEKELEGKTEEQALEYLREKFSGDALDSDPESHEESFELVEYDTAPVTGRIPEHNCHYCGDGDKVPKEHWVCPVCDAEWPPVEEDASDEAEKPGEPT